MNTPDIIEPSKKYKIGFSIYAAIGFLVLILAPTFLDPLTYNSVPPDIKIKLSQPWKTPYLEQHPRLGFWAGLAAIPLFLLIFFNPSRSAFRRGFYIFLIFTSFVCFFGFMSFGYDISFAIWGIIFGFLMTMIDHFKLKKFESMQLSDPNIETLVKVEKVKGIKDFWNTVQWGTFALWGLLFILGCLAILNFSNLFGGPQYAGIPTYAMLLNLIYPSLGIAQGILGTVFERKKEINTLLNEIKTQVPIAPREAEDETTIDEEKIKQKESFKAHKLEILADGEEKKYSDLPEIEKNKLKYLIWLNEIKDEFLISGKQKHITQTSKRVLIKLLRKCGEVIYFYKLADHQTGSRNGSSDTKEIARKSIGNLNDQTGGALRKNIIAVPGLGYKFEIKQPEFNYCIIFPKDESHYNLITDSYQTNEAHKPLL